MKKMEMKETETNIKIEEKIKRMKSSFLKASKDVEIVNMAKDGMEDYSLQLKSIHLLKNNMSNKKILRLTII